MKHGFTLTLLLFTTGLATANLATAQPLTASLHPRRDRLPAPRLEDRAAKPGPGTFPLLDCLNSLVRGDTVRAEKSCSAALALNDREHDAYKLRGYAYLTEHRFERAGADFKAALQLKPNDDQDRAGYAQSLSGQGRFHEAVVQYRMALDLAPAKAPYWNGLCWARAGTGQHLGQALRECNQALSLQAGAPGALNSRGLVYLRLKQFDRSIADYTASLKAGPLQASAWFGRGLARLHAGENVKAKADIAEARRLDAKIDTLFVILGILPAQCFQASIACPRGFPKGPGVPGSAYLVAGLSADQDAAPLKPHAKRP